MSSSILTKFKSSPSFSFRAKFTTPQASTNPQHLPSPNQYSPQKPNKNPVKIVFAKSLRKTFFDRALEKSPGPGQYETNTSRERSYSSQNNEAKNRTFTSRFVEKLQQKPGPGAYEIKNDFKKTLPSFSMSKKTKTFHEIQQQRNSFKQAPGAYDIEPKLSQTSSLMQNANLFRSIPKSPRLVHKESTMPGPGKYETGQDFYSQRSFGKRNFSTSERKISFEMKNQSPGRSYCFIAAGNYISESSFQKNKRKEKGFSCRKRLIDILKRDDVPGPGVYEAKSQISFRSIEGTKMSKANRNTLAHVNAGDLQTPGPGKYENLPETYTKLKFKSRSAPKFSKAKLQKISAIQMDTTDKFYDPKISAIKRSASSFSIGGEKRKHIFDQESKLPGPGQYNHHEVKVVNESVLTNKFPKSLRSNPILNKLPVGPGEYFNPEEMSSIGRVGTKFSKGERKTDFSHIENQTKSIIRISNPSNFNNLAPIVKR